MTSQAEADLVRIIHIVRIVRLVRLVRAALNGLSRRREVAPPKEGLSPGYENKVRVEPHGPTCSSLYSVSPVADLLSN